MGDTILNLKKQIDGLKLKISEVKSRISVLGKTSKFLDSVNEEKEKQDAMDELQNQLGLL